MSTEKQNRPADTTEMDYNPDETIEIALIKELPSNYNNGLDPVEVELITYNGTEDVHHKDDDTSSAEFISNLTEPKETEKLAEVTSLASNEEIKSLEMVVTNSPVSNDSSATVPKMSREMRNLQKSTQDSKVLSKYLNDDSPRVRRNKIKEINSLVNESDATTDSPNATGTISSNLDAEEPLKGETQDHDSDSTVVVRDESSKKRRRSVSRPRSSYRTKSMAATRAKSLSRMFSADMSANSDKEEPIEDEEIDELANVSTAAMKPIENRAPNPPPKPGWDSYCFKCHLDSAVLSLACKNCKCSFHRHCARVLYTPIPKNTDDFVCADCLEIDKIENGTVNKYNHAKIDLHTLKEMLLTILEKIRTYPDRDCYENDIQVKSVKETNQPLIITQISLRTIEERIMNNYYKVSEAFLHDIKQLEHNWTLVDKNKTKSLKNILKFVVTEINEMEACVHCYSSSFVISNWFTIPCKRPHLLIWAKLKGYPYWPAKVMSIDNQKLYADVRFFGAHDRAWVPTSHCLIFSEKDPNKTGKTSTPTSTKSTSKSQKGIFDAMKEKDEYIQNVREKYGFRLAANRELLEPNMFQKQLEAQLPNLKRDPTNNGTEKGENESNQKEKLTLKIVKTSDGTQTIEQRTPKIGQDKDRHILYTVLSKNEDTSENSDRVKTIILKRNKQGDIEQEKPSKRPLNTDDSETSESTVSLTAGKGKLSRRKSIRDVLILRKTRNSISSRSTTPEPSRKKAKTVESNAENELLEELPEKLTKKSRKSTFQDVTAVALANNPKVPTGTHEIHSLRESPSPRQTLRSANKNNSSSLLGRSKSVDKESVKSENSMRRLSVASSTVISARMLKGRIGKESSFRPPTPTVVKPKRSISQATNKKQDIQPQFNPDIVIKDEPMTDEDVVQREQLTVNDIAELVGEGSNKRKTILISTSDNSNDSFPQNSRARKTFPNSLPVARLGESVQASRNTNAMVCIPQVFPSEVVQMGNNNFSTNGIHEHSSSGQPSLEQISYLPRLVPKPTGVFTVEGNTFHPETGAVSALFSENAHRMTDYFKSLLIDTIGAIASGVSDAQNVLLKLEIEKMKQQMNNMKTENQQKFDKLKKEQESELRILKLTYDEKIKSINQAHEQEKKKLVTEIRQQCEIDKQRAVENAKREVKRMTWCSNCPKEARFYCCWNTSYCGPSCQKNHWSNHQKYCTNRNSNTESNGQSPPNNSRQPEMTTPMASPSPVHSFSNQIVLPNQVNKTVRPTYVTVSKNTSQHTTPPAPTQPDNTMRSPQHTIIQTGQKTIIQPHTAYVYQQHKLSPGIPPAALKVLSSQLATEQSLTHGLQNNVIVRAISQNTTPPLTILPGASELQPQIAIVNSNGSMNLQSLPSSGSSKT